MFLCYAKLEGIPKDFDHLIALSVSPVTSLAQVSYDLKLSIEARTEKKVEIIRVYRANLPYVDVEEEEDAIVDAFMSELPESLNIRRSVQKYWSADDLASDKIHLIAEVKEIKNDQSETRTQIPDSIDAVTDYLRDVLQFRNESAMKCQDMSPPSSIARASRFRKYNKGSDNLFHNMRPYSACSAPVALFHPVFGDFVRELGDTALATPSIDFSMLHEFMVTSGGIYYY
ncbi:hypothetical protein DFH11DRAFT_1728153 [Phellopilus nigrolimitatus]|nr:hypothetical protein DFH11DRAFT_1728153 [Phellopilus nigrolimitatus]